MNKAISIIVMALVTLGIIGFLYLNISEYSCDKVEIEKEGKLQISWFLLLYKRDTFGVSFSCLR